MTVSTYLNGEYGQKDIYIGVPTILNAKGAREIIELDLEDGEKEKFENSCNILRKMKEEIDKAIK